MFRRLIAIANELDSMGDYSAADDIDLKARKMFLTSNPLELAVALGLLNENVLGDDDEEESKIDPDLDKLLSDLQEA